MSDFKASVMLSLKDQFSQGIKSAGAGVEAFASKAATAIKAVDKTFSGLKTAAGALGVSLSVGSAAKEIIDLDAKMTAFGVTMNMSAERVNALKQSIFDTATAKDVKIGTDELVSAVDSIAERTGDAEFIEKNIKNIGIAIRATGAAGSDIGGLYSEIEKMGLSAEDAATAVSTLAVQGNNGAFVMKDLAALGPRTIAAYTATGRSGAKALIEMGAALQVIRRGTGSSEQAATAFEAVMRNLTSPDKQQKLRSLGVSVRDSLTGEFRPITELMTEIVEKSGGSLETLGTIFDAEAVRAFNSAIGEFKDKGAVSSFKEFNGMLDDGSYLEKAAAKNAGTLAANLKNVQTSFVKFVNSDPVGVLGKINKLLNYLGENPKRFNRVFTAIAAGIGAIAAVKGAARVIDLVNGIKTLKSGGNINIGSSVGGSGMPVYVTNWGGQAGSSPMPSAGTAGTATMPGAAATAAVPKGFKGKMAAAGSAMKTAAKGSALKAGAGGAALAALEAVPQAMWEWSDINDDETLTKKQKGKAKGGAVGAAAGKIVGAGAGAWAGAAAGAAIGSVVPVVGTAIGGAVGMGIGALAGYLGGKGGRLIGEKIGEGLTKDDAVSDKAAQTQGGTPEARGVPATSLPPEIVYQHRSGAPKYTGQPTAKLDGEASIQIDLNVKGVSGTAEAQITRNTARWAKFETGRAQTARDML